MSAKPKPKAKRRVFCEGCAHFRVLGSFNRGVMPCAKKRRQTYVYPVNGVGDPHGLVPAGGSRCFEASVKEGGVK